MKHMRALVWTAVFCCCLTVGFLPYPALAQNDPTAAQQQSFFQEIFAWLDQHGGDNKWNSPSPPTPVNGVCGSSNGLSVLIKPTTNLCSAGTATALTGTGPWDWQCTGSNKGTTASCTADLAVNFPVKTISVSPTSLVPGQTVKFATSIAADQTVSNYSMTLAVVSGSKTIESQNITPVSFSTKTTSNSYQWTLPTTTQAGAYQVVMSLLNAKGVVEATSTTTFTVLPLPVNGACGTSNGSVTMMTPSTNLCSGGTSTTVSGSGPWTWSCAGLNGGTNASCSATLPKACIDANNVSHASGTTYTLQTSQSTGSIAATTAQCSYGGTQAITVTATQSYSCTNGTQTAQGSPTVTTVNTGNPVCAPVNGACGLSNGKMSYYVQTSQLCSSGTAANVSKIGAWTWSCVGSNGGTTAQCNDLSLQFTSIADYSTKLCINFSGDKTLGFLSCTEPSLSNIAQTYGVEKTSDGYYQIDTQNITDGLCLDYGHIGAGSTPYGSAVTLTTCSTSSATQKWVINSGYSNNFTITTANGGGCLDVGTGANPSPVLNRCNFATATQYFTLPNFSVASGTIPASLPAPVPGLGLTAIAAQEIGYAGTDMLYAAQIPLAEQLNNLFVSEGMPGQRIGWSFQISTTKNPADYTDGDQWVLSYARSGIRPLFILGWGSPQPIGSVPASDWYAAGQYAANRYQPNSAWLLSQGVKDWGITTYEAFNEPDDISSVAPDAILQAYHDAMQAYANGIHSVNPALKVISGGFCSCNKSGSHGQTNTNGFAPAIADLYNNGTLAGMDLHTYNGWPYTPIEGGQKPFSAQYCFDGIKATAGITADIDFYATEYNNGFGGTIHAGTSSAMGPTTEAYGAQGFLAATWAEFGIVKNDGKTSAAKFVAPWNMTQTNTTAPSFAMATQVTPTYVPNASGRVYAMLMKLTSGMAFDPTSAHMDPRGLGELVMAGDGKTLYVWQDWSGWTNHFGSTYTVDIPAGATHLDVYGWDGLRQSYSVMGSSKYTVTGLTTNETHMFLVY